MKFSLLLTIVLVYHSFKPAKSFPVNCQFQDIEFYVIGHLYTCISTVTAPPGNGTAVTSITGTHAGNRTNADVQALYIQSDNSLSFFPRRFSDFFPDVRGLVVLSTSIDTLHGDELSEFGNLQVFELQFSSLVTVNDGLFVPTPNISRIYMGYNQIQMVGHDLFTPLNIPQMTILWMGANPCNPGGAPAETQQAILELIETIRRQCPIDGSGTVPTTPGWTTTTSRPPPGDCGVCNIYEAICELQSDVATLDSHLFFLNMQIRSLENQMNVVNGTLLAHDNRIRVLEGNLVKRDARISQLESDQQWMRQELLRLIEMTSGKK